MVEIYTRESVGGRVSRVAPLPLHSVIQGIARERARPGPEFVIRAKLLCIPVDAPAHYFLNLIPNKTVRAWLSLVLSLYPTSRLARETDRASESFIEAEWLIG
jgi:hypothetical protein